MGGLGSGDWFRVDKKSTVEESLVIAMKGFRNRLAPGTSGTFTWTWAGGTKSSIGYYVTGTPDAPALTLHYRWRGTEDVSIQVRLTTTGVQFGGRRWWFVCPLIVRGVKCDRRAAKLYLPPGARYFGCRKCHDLTYQSCQEAHQTERMFARLGFDAEAARAWKRRHRCK